jgi:hypothetical protein
VCKNKKEKAEKSFHLSAVGEWVDLGGKQEDFTHNVVEKR